MENSKNGLLAMAKNLTKYCFIFFGVHYIAPIILNDTHVFLSIIIVCIGDVTSKYFILP